MTVLTSGSKFVTNVSALTNTSDTDCYVVPSNFSSHIEHVMISNNDTGNHTYTLKYRDASAATTHTLQTTHTISSKSSVSVFTVDKPLYVNAGDKIIVAATTADTLTVVVTAEEFYEPNR